MIRKVVIKRFRCHQTHRHQKIIATDRQKEVPPVSKVQVLSPDCSGSPESLVPVSACHESGRYREHASGAREKNKNQSNLPRTVREKEVIVRIEGTEKK